MARETSKPRKNESFDLHVNVSGDLVLKIDAIAKKLEVELGQTTRSDVVRRALIAYVNSYEVAS